MRSRSIAALAAAMAVCGAFGPASKGSVIVDLPTGSAIVTSNDTAGQTVTSITPNQDNSVLAPAVTNLDGLSMNLTITPTAADLVGTRLLMEIGGSSNGTGFFLVNGVPTVVSKQNSGGAIVPGNTLDTDLAGNTMTADYAGGTTLLAGSTYTVAAILGFSAAGGSNQATSVTIAVDDGGLGNAVTSTSYALTDATTNGINWAGNRSVSVKTKTTTPGVVGLPAIGNLGGTHESLTADATFFAGSAGSQADGIQSFAGATADGYMWNAVGGVVPEPASLSLLAAAGLLATRRHRRSRR